MALNRFAENPLITPAQVVASHPDFEVIGTFNAGAALYHDEVILLVRVAERPLALSANEVLYPVLDERGVLTIRAIRQDDPRYDVRDPRIIRDLRTGAVFLTSMSHLRLARSRDGIHFAVENHPFLTPQMPYEAFGVEDARITRIDGAYYINYSAVSPLGIATGLVSTRDFVQVERHGIILPPANRDVVLFPEKIGGRYWCYHRPMPAYIGDYNIWVAESPDLLHWGNHRALLRVEPGGWEAGRVGGGAPPIHTPEGWLSIYHAADPHDRYCLGAFLTALDDPTRIIARSKTPILEPDAPYEAAGFFPNVVFTCGAVVRDGTLIIYYGGADYCIAAASVPIAEMVEGLLRG